MHGVEWVVEAWGCSAAALRDQRSLDVLFQSLICDLNLRPIGESIWHVFPGSGGITGLCLLSESHLACHTFPEHASLCLNLFCCLPRAEWPFVAELQNRFAASEVAVRRLQRPYALPNARAVNE
ncbi:MAG: S-adenosylmethionine decarboxylase [Candidatus Acidiferrum sp.]|jgi:S-adenosylmethionine decarboxylase